MTFPGREPIAATKEEEAMTGIVHPVQCPVTELLGFERLVKALSSRFIHVQTELVDTEIESSMQEVCEALGLDRAELAKYDDISRRFRITHQWAAPGVELLPELIPEAQIPWIATNIQRGQYVQFSSVDEFPEDAVIDRESTRTIVKAKSGTILPLSAGGKIFGAIAFDAILASREWPQQVTERLQLIAEIFANALARKRTTEQLRESEEKFHLATESAQLGVWEWKFGEPVIWGSEQNLRLCGLTTDATLTFDFFIRSIHAEDLEKVKEVVALVQQNARTFSMEYRLIRPDGEVRWMVTRGRSYANGNGVPDRVTGISLDITEKKQAEEKLRNAYSQIKVLKERLENENFYLQQEIKLEHQHHEVIGQSEGIRRALRSAEQVAGTNSTVMLQGETGTGKELFARAIHNLSNRKDRSMVKVNCAALPASLVESELFGREKGAYTGALTREMGRFEVANGSTLFLDEIGELPLELQAKLLRVLQEGEFERLGSSKTIKVDVRVVVATARDLASMVREGKFREDLYYRVSVFPIHIPPLRERREDIPMLVWHFVRDIGRRMGRNIEDIRATTMKALQNYEWPGNVRELKNVIERHLITTSGPIFQADLTGIQSVASKKGSTLEAVEADYIGQVLKSTGGRIRGAGGAAQVLGLKPSTLESRMKKLGIPRK